MAKPDNRHQQHKGTGKVHLDKDDDDALGEAQDEREREQAKPDDEDPDKKDKEKEGEKAAKLPTPKVAEGEVVTINMFVDVDPAPTVGHPGHGGYSFIEHGIMKLEARKSYVVPAIVAEHLADKKMCSIAGA